jgi:hypothetical protein
MLKSINTIIIMMLLILFSMLQLGYQHEAEAQYTTVVEPGSGRGILVCPTGEQHEVAIALEAFSIPSFRGAFDISISNNSGSFEVYKSGVIDYVKIYSTGEFILKGEETRDDICDGLRNSLSPISIEITGECDFNPASGVRSTVKFRASNGEKADFPSSPTCS